jgi:hypothetical protein
LPHVYDNFMLWLIDHIGYKNTLIAKSLIVGVAFSFIGFLVGIAMVLKVIKYTRRVPSLDDEITVVKFANKNLLACNPKTIAQSLEVLIMVVMWRSGKIHVKENEFIEYRTKRRVRRYLIYITVTLIVIIYVGLVMAFNIVPHTNFRGDFVT